MVITGPTGKKAAVSGQAGQWLRALSARARQHRLQTDGPGAAVPLGFVQSAREALNGPSRRLQSREPDGLRGRNMAYCSAASPSSRAAGGRSQHFLPLAGTPAVQKSRPPRTIPCSTAVKESFVLLVTAPPPTSSQGSRSSSRMDSDFRAGATGGGGLSPGLTTLSWHTGPCLALPSVFYALAPCALPAALRDRAHCTEE